MSNYRDYSNDAFINFEGIQKFQQELGRLFEGDWIKPSARYTDVDGVDGWVPAADTVETETGYAYLIDLPGVALGNVDVSIHRGEIKVSGTVPEMTAGKIINKERAHGTFERVFRLPDDADESTLAASMQAGVLNLTVSRSTSKARSIPVKDVD